MPKIWKEQAKIKNTNTLLKLTKEEKFAILCQKIALADGETDVVEIKKLISLAEANDLDGLAVNKAWNEECDNPHNFIEVLETVTDEDERDFLFFAAGRIAAAYNVLTIKELNRIFRMADVWNWANGYVAMKIVQMLKKFPELKVEGVE